MTKTIHSDFSGHTLFVQEIKADEFPTFEYKDCYTKFYEVRNFDAKGVLFMYLGTDAKRKEIVAWYGKTGAFWSGFGKSLKSAIEGAQKDGWMYA